MSGGADISQAEADRLMALPKRVVTAAELKYPNLGRSIAVDLQSVDRREAFKLDIARSHVKLTKATFQTRARLIVILARLDLDGAPHTNPDGDELPCPHIHLYREGFGDKWAYPVPDGVFGNTSDRQRTLQDFLSYCAIEPISFTFDLLG